MSIFNELFNPNARHREDEKARHEWMRDDAGDADPHKGPIDLDCGTVQIRFDAGQAGAEGQGGADSEAGADEKPSAASDSGSSSSEAALPGPGGSWSAAIDSGPLTVRQVRKIPFSGP